MNPLPSFRPLALALVLISGLVVTTAVATPALAAKAENEQVDDILQRIASANDGETRLQASAELAALGPDAIDALRDFLDRKRSAEESQRRAVLSAIKADLPDSKGRFHTPRGGKEGKNSEDEFDWLKELAKSDDTAAGYGEVFADVAAIRALAATGAARAATVILDFTFSKSGLIYRDECGRYLRKMSPYSLPALVVASLSSKRGASHRRYANYQLDRLDRDDPNRALAYASTDTDLLLALLKAYGQAKHREAIIPLLRYADHAAPAVRETARQAVLSYVTGKKPKEAPKRKLTLPGGKLTEEEQPLYMNSRDLATVQIVRTYEAMFEDQPPRRTSTAKLAKLIFKRMDSERVEAQEQALKDAKALAEARKWADAAAAFDRILAVMPDHPHKKAMADTYFQHGRALAEAGAYHDAAAAFSKAHGLDPEGELAEKALSNHYAALGKALEADGKDASAAFRRARVSETSGADADDVLAPRGVAKPRPRWMLYAGLGGGAGALIFMILGLAIRRR